MDKKPSEPQKDVLQMIQPISPFTWTIVGIATWWRCVLVFLLTSGCAGTSYAPQDEPLPPPEQANHVVAPLILEGNRLYFQKRFRDAEMKYQGAIDIQSSVGEAHYNLGLALSQRKLHTEARPHFEKAAELEPFNQVIRNAPPFRKYEPPAPRVQEPAHDGHMGHQH